jgi:hypothetical protein
MMDQVRSRLIICLILILTFDKNVGKLISSNENLEFSFASHSNSGSYECVSDNGIDHKLRKIIHIKVNGK